MDHEETGEGASKETARSRRRPAGKRIAEAQPNQAEPSFLTKEDLSNFLSIKPYLSENGRAVVDILEEIERTGGRLDPAVLTKFAGLMGGGNNQNLAAALGPLLNMVGTGGKMDPTALLPLLAGSGGGKMDPSALLPLLTAMTQMKKE